MQRSLITLVLTGVVLASDTPTQHNQILPEWLLTMPQKMTADDDYDDDIDHDEEDEDVDNLIYTSPACTIFIT